MARLAGKSAVVTGGGSGLGRAIVAAFLDEGARVLAFDRHFDGENEGRREDTLIQVEGDVRDDAAVNAAVDRAAGSFGGLHVICNVAGIAAFGTLEDSGLGDVAEVMDVNFYGAVRFMKAAIPHLLASGSGAIINVASVGAIRARPRLGAYAASKAALVAFTRGVAIDYADHGVVANTIMPGVFDTPMIGSAEGTAARAGRGQPLGRVGEAREIAALAVFLASDECRYATGSEFIVDGGRSAT